MYDVTLDDFSQYDWQSAVSKAPPLPFYEYSTRFFQAAAAHEQQGDARGTRVFGLLGAICNLPANWSGQQKPFVSRIATETVRSTDITNFSEAHRTLLTGLIPKTNDPQLRARFADVGCTIKFDHGLARTAASAYLDAVRLLAEPDDWTIFFDYLERAGQLAASIGKSHPEFKAFVSEAKKLVDRFRSDDSGFASSKIIELLLEHEEADPSIYGPISIQLAERAEKNKKFLVARTYWQLAAIFNRRLKNEQIEQHCLIRSAETHASEALEFLAGEKVSHLAAAHHFSCAVFALRQAGAPKERIEELHQKLVEEQKLGMEEMGAFSASPVDLSELADAARKMVRNKDLQTALIVLAFGRGLVDFENFKKDVIKSAGEHPFLALVPIATTDSQGRTTARRASLWDAEKGGNDEAVLLETFHRLSSIQWPINVHAYIHPASIQIWTEHQPNERDLRFIVQDNPAIPPGHHHSILRGLQAGPSGDLHAAAYFLIPQFEGLIRHVLASNNIIISRLDNQLIQDVHLLGSLLQLPETTEIFGADLVLTMRGPKEIQYGEAPESIECSLLKFPIQ